MNQHNQILQILEQCGNAGMNSWQYRTKFIQLPVRVLELRKKGYLIVSKRNEDTSVNYVLLSKIKKIEPKTEYVWVFKNGFAKQVLKNNKQEQLSL